MAKRSTKSSASPPSTNKRLGRLYITETGTLFTENDLKQFEMPQSKQLDPIGFEGIPIIEPPFDLAKLMAWMDMSVPHNAAIRTKVQDAVGIGWHLNQDGDAASEEGHERLEQFFNRVNENEDINALSNKVFIDYEGCGNGYIEVARDESGEISALYHIPAVTVRIHRQRNRFVQKIGMKQVWFKHFGDERVLNKNTGRFEAVEKPDDVANEIIVLQNYTWRSQHYGLPEWLPAIYPMFAEQKEKEYNINFFSSFGIPAYAVVLEHMELLPDHEDAIKRYFETEVKGNPHKTMVFSTPEGANIRFEPLNVQTKEASFRLFRRDNRDDILSAHRVPPYRAGIVIQGQLGGTAAAEVDRIYLASVINPRQQEYEWIINNLLIKQGFQIEGWHFEFDDILIDDRLLQAQIDQIYFSIGARTANEIRMRNGEEPYPEGDAFFITQRVADPESATADSGELVKSYHRNGSPAPYLKVGKSATGYAEYVKRRRSDTAKRIERVERELAQALAKDFARQGRALIQYLTENKILERVREMAERVNPAAFERKEKRFYEVIQKQLTPDQMRELTSLVSGWESAASPERMADALGDFAVKAGDLGGLAALRRMGIRVDFGLKNERLVNELVQRGVKITGDIAEKTLEDFRGVLVREFFEEGAGIPDVKRAIRDLFEETYKNRAETIARTETGIAVETVQNEAYQRNGVEKKQWLATLDTATRPAHLQAHQQVVPVNEPFIVGGEELDHPLDPDGSPENIINCRCTTAPVLADRDDVPTWSGE